MRHLSETVQLKIIRIDFDDNWRKYSKTLEYSLHISVFMWVCFFINFSSFKPDTENYANIGDLSSERANLDALQ